MKKYYSIRVVKGEDTQGAVENVIDGKFDEKDKICDKVLDIEELFDFALERYRKELKHGRDNRV